MRRGNLGLRVKILSIRLLKIICVSSELRCVQFSLQRRILCGKISLMEHAISSPRSHVASWCHVSRCHISCVHDTLVDLVKILLLESLSLSLFIELIPLFNFFDILLISDSRGQRTTLFIATVVPCSQRHFTHSFSSLLFVQSLGLAAFICVITR